MLFQVELFLLVVAVDVAEVLQRLVVWADDGEHALEGSEFVHSRVGGLVGVRYLEDVKE